MRHFFVRYEIIRSKQHVSLCFFVPAVIVINITGVIKFFSCPSRPLGDIDEGIWIGKIQESKSVVICFYRIKSDKIIVVLIRIQGKLRLLVILNSAAHRSFAQVIIVLKIDALQYMILSNDQVIQQKFNSFLRCASFGKVIIARNDFYSYSNPLFLLWISIYKLIISSIWFNIWTN